jgi:hypothetical protein
MEAGRYSNTERALEMEVRITIPVGRAGLTGGGLRRPLLRRHSREQIASTESNSRAVTINLAVAVFPALAKST